MVAGSQEQGTHVTRLLYLANAASVHTRKWVNYFAEAGHEVHLVTWHKPGTPSGIAHPVRMHRVVCPPHFVMRYGTLLEVRRIVRTVRPDLVHAHYLSHFGLVGGLLARTSGFHPLVLTAWGSDVMSQSEGSRGRLVSSALRQADCVTCDSPHMVPRLVSLGASSDAVHIINFGVDTERFRPQTPQRDIKGELDLRYAAVVISLRSLRPVYDVATLIRAAPAVLRAVPQAVFLVAGRGEEEANLRSLATSLGVAGHVRFLGMVANEALPDYLNSADVYVSTSLSDAGIAASTAEAMACGLPAVVTDFGDNGSWVKDGETGYLFPCGDSDRLAERLIQLLGDSSLRERLGANGRREIVQRNSYQGEMKKMESIYFDLIERCRR